jgi:hypothetical protein
MDAHPSDADASPTPAPRAAMPAHVRTVTGGLHDRFDNGGLLKPSLDILTMRGQQVLMDTDNYLSAFHANPIMSSLGLSHHELDAQ